MRTAGQTVRYRWGVLCRLLLAVVGGYGITAQTCVVLAHALPALGAMERSHAVLLATLISFVLYTVVVLWAFHEQRLTRVAAVQAGAAAVLAGTLLALKVWA